MPGFSSPLSIVVFALVGSALLSTAGASASLRLSDRPLVYDGSAAGITVKVRNDSAERLAVQVWVSEKACDDGLALAPVAANPPMFRLEPHGVREVTLMRMPGYLPDDRESVLFVSAKEGPLGGDGVAAQGDAMCRRVRMFYRPPGLEGRAEDAPATLRWEAVRKDGRAMLHVLNPSPFHVRFRSLLATVQGDEREVGEPETLKPYAEQWYAIGDIDAGAEVKIAYVPVRDDDSDGLPLIVVVH